MKRIPLLFLIAFMSLTCSAETHKSLDSRISDVVVYKKGAQVTRKVETNLQAGRSTLLFQGLTSKIREGSVQVRGPEEVTIVSVVHNTDYLSQKEASKEIKELEDRRLVILDSISLSRRQLEVFRQEKELLLANKSIGSDEKGVNVNELRMAADFFRKRLFEIDNHSLKIEKDVRNNKEFLVKVSKQLLELNAQKDQPTSEVKVTIASPKATKAHFELCYIVNEAGWTPTYDIRVKDTDHPLNMVYKAKVHQNTDEDWENVKLTLSTGNISLSNTCPELDTYALTFDNYYRSPKEYQIQEKKLPFRGVVRGKVTDESGEGIPGANVVVKGTTVGVVTDIDGNYELEVPWGHKALVVSFIGFDNVEKDIDSDVVNVSLKGAEMALDEVVVVAYGQSTGRGVYRGMQGKVAGVQTSRLPKKKAQIPLAIEKHQTTTDFKIELPYSIPSDNKPYDVAMVEYQMPVDFEYSCVPKLSRDAFLMAKITDWTSYNLLEGEAQLFYQGIYQGNTFLDPASFEDTLKISIGRDKDIAIKREIQKDFVNKRLIGSVKKELRSWEITLRNNKSYPITLTVNDQYPVSKDSDIKVEHLDHSGANLDEDSGKLTWQIALKPHESKKLTVQYSVRYPKNKTMLVE